MSTPRTTRSKSRAGSVTPAVAEMPALPPKASRSYGAHGKLVLPAGLKSESAIADMSKALDEKRGTANVEQESENADGAGTVKAKGRGRRAATPRKSPSVRSRANSRRAATPLTPIQESRESPSAEEESRREQIAATAQLLASSSAQDTGADSDDESTVKTNSEEMEEAEKQVEAENELSGRNSTQRQSRAQATHSTVATQRSPSRSEKQPAQPTHSNQNDARRPPDGWERITEAFQSFRLPAFEYWQIPLYFFALSLALGSVFLLSRIASGTYHTVQTWNSEQYHNSTLRHISKVDGKVSLLAKEVTSVEKTNNRLEKSIAELLKILPNVLIVDKQADGTYKIPEYFWQALKDREDAPAWERFVAKNKVELDSYVATHSENHLQTALDTKRLVSSEVFTDMLATNYEQMQANLRQLADDIDARIATIHADTTKVATEIFDQRFRHSSNAELNLLTSANLIRNAENALRSVNFFSPNLGAIVNPNLSSPTYQKVKNETTLASYYVWLQGPRGTQANPPMAALERWDEAGDCWCAAPPKPYIVRRALPASLPSLPPPAKAQLGVTMPFPVYPKTVTIEHIPKEGTLDINSAPAEMELWLHVANGTALDMVGRRAVEIKLVDKFEDAYDTTSGAPYELEPAYVLVARWKYDIHAINHIQTFNIPIDMAEYHVGIEQAVIRAKTNNGADHTCFYRVRVSGLVKRIEDEKIRAAEEADAAYTSSSSASWASKTNMWKEQEKTGWGTVTGADW